MRIPGRPQNTTKRLLHYHDCTVLNMLYYYGCLVIYILCDAMIYWKHLQPALNETVCILFKKKKLWCLTPLSTLFFNSMIKKASCRITDTSLFEVVVALTTIYTLITLSD